MRQVDGFTAHATTSSARTTAGQAQQALDAMRCFRLDTENYCLGLGFVDQKPSSARIILAATTADGASALAAGPTGAATGAVSVAGFVGQRAALTPTARRDAELVELRTAWDGRAKALALRTAGTTAAGGTMRTDGARTISRTPPSSFYLMYGYQTSQERSYWCGPATMQSIDWGNDRSKASQLSWANAMGTTSGGTAITSMVRQTNVSTTWDVAAGAYITQGVGSWSWQKFFTIHQTHLGDGTPGPIIEHPQLLKRYFPYLAFNHSGHFQVGRGYSRTSGTISIFEVFNERRFNSAGRTTNGIKNIPASAMFSATLANQFKNIGL